VPGDGAAQALEYARLVGDRGLELHQPVIDQPVSDVASAALRPFSRLTTRQIDSDFGHLRLVALRPLCESFDLVTIPVARRKRHRRVVARWVAAEHPLAEELRWVDPFLSIMRQRFGERLRTHVQVSEAAARCVVPSLLLMAPVENAVKHGVARSAGGVDVQVVADVVDGCLRIDILDTGDAPLAANAGGTGLANLRARLATLHGDAADVVLAREGDRTRVRVTLPARTGGAA